MCSACDDSMELHGTPCPLCMPEPEPYVSPSVRIWVVAAIAAVVILVASVAL